MADEQVSKMTQFLVTFGLGGAAAFMCWPHLDQTAKGIVMLFAVVAGMSIYQGTWMQNSRELRRAQRDQRRETYREAKEYMFGKTKEKAS